MMKTALSKIFNTPFLLIFLAVFVKIPMFFTKNIQEDSFITWRVARNFVKYGVIGFSGDERISASTTHLYVLITAFFQLVFGEGFIYPVLIFSGILFAIGSWWLAKILFPNEIMKRGFFFLLLNITPPALTASFLGMEYGILFFLYNGLIYFGLFKNKKWAYFLFPILLLWTRLDAVIFLGIFFLGDLYLKRKINFIYILGGIIGVVTVVGFNYLYFGEIVNHTITAKKIAYKNLMQNNSLKFLLYQWAYYGGLIKKYGIFTFLLFVAFLTFLGYAIFKIIKNNKVGTLTSKLVLVLILVFALTKITLFSFLKAYFDWYYWLPRVFLFAVILYYFLNINIWKRKSVLVGISILFIGLYFFQMVQSCTIGYMEERQRMTIAADINKDEVGIEKSILLEPAGIIPFYTQLYTYDEVGLVNARINDEMLNDEDYWWINSVNKFHPDYILTIAKKPGDNDSFYKIKPESIAQFDHDYELVKVYPIAKIHDNAPFVLKWIYQLRPIGKDYFLYKKRTEKP
ncbi:MULTISPECIES: hypothetical protein [unclassified Kaistella]|uniref:hypothetical protein n=1 Tax=unclassified Kaistella TaxID=2762626 RepID=UPI0027332C6F|nr:MULTISPECIES: hypothetical protein [unclassified Kaistella]MDP2452719.1 hypothetical protein [Kaistella sp. SH11-4b]MDP2455628.1 hypothetical protein [Kaistella sp. SH40-3]MDP2458532.1 hypothetical protein [Kaistella sp. SH19-2b]